MKTLRTMLATAAFICLPLVARAAPQTTCTTKTTITVNASGNTVIRTHKVCTTEATRTAPSAPRK